MSKHMFSLLGNGSDDIDLLKMDFSVFSGQCHKISKLTILMSNNLEIN